MPVVAFYFGYLTTLGVVRRRVRPTAFALLMVVSVLLIGMPHVMPLIYLLIGYWLPAMLVRTPNVAFERHLLQFDRTLFGADGLEAFARRAPRALLEYLEFSYLLCYAVVPAGLVWLTLAGVEANANRFWSIVLLSSFACYGVLPWLPTRAPRAVEGTRHGRSLIRHVNLHVLDRASVQWNTFPSGHTAASAATALAVASDAPIAGIVLGVVAASIAVGSVVGRYHYAADAIAGGAVAVAAWVTASAVHAL
jgi:membrane-associated phospholipid phosphatase